MCNCPYCRKPESKCEKRCGPLPLRCSVALALTNSNAKDHGKVAPARQYPTAKNRAKCYIRAPRQGPPQCSPVRAFCTGPLCTAFVHQPHLYSTRICIVRIWVVNVQSASCSGVILNFPSAPTTDAAKRPGWKNSRASSCTSSAVTLSSMATSSCGVKCRSK